MNQPSSSLSLDLDKFSNSSDSLSECETLTVPDPNDPVTIRKFVDETVIGPISLQEQNIDHISAINTELHIGTVHKNIFHFHGNIKPPSQTNGERQQNGTDETHHLSDNVEITSSSNLHKMNAVFRSKPVILSLTFLALVLLTLTLLITVGSIERTTDPYSNIWLINRELWQGLDPLEPLALNGPALLVVIKHTGGAGCTYFTTCSFRVREIQKKDMEQYPDIRYNFLIGGDGRIYEGRGWLVQNEGTRNESVDIAFIGNFNTDVPSTLMLSRALYLVTTGQDQNKINYISYCVMAHNHTEPTDSPGENVYKLLRTTFFHFSSEICYDRVIEKVVPTDTCPPTS